MRLILVLLSIMAVFGQQFARACALEAGEKRTVTDVIDGETLALDDGSQLRLVGALAPEAPYGREAHWPQTRAAQRALELLVLSRTIELRLAGRDRYGRYLAQAFVLDGGEEVWVQGAMISAGHARAYALPGSESCLADLLVRERVARDARLGLWSTPAYTVRDALRPQDISRLAGSFAVVEGKVIRAAAVGPTIYLNFGADWRRDFTVAIPKRLLKGSTPEIYEGRDIRVRGWVQRRNGPLIAVSTLEEIEFVGESSLHGAIRQAPG